MQCPAKLAEQRSTLTLPLTFCFFLLAAVLHQMIWFHLLVSQSLAFSLLLASLPFLTVSSRLIAL